MKCAVFSFTQNGNEIKDKITGAFSKTLFRNEEMEIINYSSKDEIRQAFEECQIILFISACGICVRLIAPFLRDKLTDPAVVVIDERGNFVIPICSGHVGGGNEIAKILAEYLEAVPVITTATDVNGLFAIDEFAADNKLKILNRNNIKSVNKKLLINQPVNISVCDDVVITINEEDIRDNELGLLARPIVAGIGCRKGKSFEELKSFLLDTLSEIEVDVNLLSGIASIDVKKHEEGLVSLSEYLNIPFVTYSADTLNKVEGDFEEDSFSKEIVGVSDVSARSAKALGGGGKFLVHKKIKDGMTISIFEKYLRLTVKYEES